MPGSVPQLRIWLAFALLGVLWPALAARPARAMGCHAPERPALGLSGSWERQQEPVLPRLVIVEPTRSFVPVPCTGDVPGSPESGGPTLGLSEASSIRPPIAAMARRRIPRPRLVLPHPLPSRLDRPPRPSAPPSGTSAA